MTRWLVVVATVLMSPHAAAKQPGPDLTGPETVEDLVADLAGADDSDRLFAARELRRRVRSNSRLTERARGDELVVLQARQDLQDLRRDVVPICQEQIQVRNVTAPCADILGVLGAATSISVLEARLTTETRGWVLRRLERALLNLNSAGMES